MPVNDIAEEDEPITRIELAQQIVSRATGATDRVPLRVLVLFVVAVVCATLAPIPANVVGVAALVLLALDVALHRRQS
jgi:hypothetical protein